MRDLIRWNVWLPDSAGWVLTRELHEPCVRAPQRLLKDQHDQMTEELQSVVEAAQWPEGRDSATGQVVLEELKTWGEMGWPPLHVCVIVRSSWYGFGYGGVLGELAGAWSLSHRGPSRTVSCL